MDSNTIKYRLSDWPYAYLRAVMLIPRHLGVLPPAWLYRWAIRIALRPEK